MKPVRVSIVLATVMMAALLSVPTTVVAQVPVVLDFSTGTAGSGGTLTISGSNQASGSGILIDQLTVSGTAGSPMVLNVDGTGPATPSSHGSTGLFEFDTTANTLKITGSVPALGIGQTTLLVGAFSSVSIFTSATGAIVTLRGLDFKNGDLLKALGVAPSSTPYSFLLSMIGTSNNSGGYTVTSTDFANTSACTGSIGDFVWNDLNHDGVQNAGEPGIPNITVQLWDSTHATLLALSTTNANGIYGFTGLCANTYQVVVPPQAGLTGWVASPTGVGSPATDSNPNPSLVTVPTNSSDTTIDFGYYFPPAKLRVVKTPDGHTADGGTFLPGAPVSFKITVFNDGAAAATNVILDDQLPGGGGLVWALAPGSPSQGSCSISVSNNLHCTLGTIPGGQSAVVTLTSAQNPVAACRDQFNPVALATADGNLSAQDSGDLICSSTVLSLKTVDPGATVAPNTPVTITVKETNTSGSPINTVSVTGTECTTWKPVGVPDANLDPTKSIVLNLAAGTSVDFSCTFTPGNTTAWSATGSGKDQNGNSIPLTGETTSGSITVTVTANCVTIVAIQGVAITPVTMTASGGTGAPYTFSATGLPAGLTMSPGGTISGTPTVNGSFNYTVTVTDKDGNTGSVNCSVTVNPPPSATCVTINATQGVPIPPVTMIGSGGTGGPYTFSATGLPAGLTMSTSGTISGTPTVNGSFNYTVTVKDKDGNTGSVNCSVTVNAPASLGDFVWHDLNANGQQDAGEPGIPGVLVTLLKCDGTPTGMTTTTNAAGLYAFTNLVPGCYKVQFATPAGFIPTPANVGSDITDSDAVGGVTGNYTLNAGDNNTTVDAGFYKLASLGDFVWNDVNVNGQQDAGEAGIPGVNVTLLYCDNTPTGMTTTTNAGGLYVFVNLVPGCYKVQFATPAGYTPTAANAGSDITDSDAVGGLTGNYVLNSGDNNTTVDAGFFVPTPGLKIVKTANSQIISPYQSVTYSYIVTNTGSTTLTNIVVTDDNGTPGFAGDDFIVGTIPSLAPGASVTLTATVIPPVTTISVVNGNPVNAGVVVVVTQLGNGDIKVTYLQSFGINDNTYGTGAIGWPNGHKFSDLTGSDHLEFRFFDKNGNVVLDFYQDYISATANTATYPSGYASLCASGGDGFMVSGSAANIVSCTTSLADNLNNPLNLPNKAALIVNSPTSLVAGNVVVDMTKAPGGWNYINSYTVVVKSSTFGAAGFGSLAIPDQHNSPSKLGVNQITTTPRDSTVTNTATAKAGTLTAIATASIAIVTSPSSLSGYVYVDANNNGLKEAGEAPIAGVTVTLTGTNAIGPVAAVATTDASGFYSFPNLLPGTYTITETQPAAYLDGKDAIGSQGGTTGNDVLSNILLAANVNGINNNFGELVPASVSGFVYYDANNNGIKEGGEAPIAGATLTLTGTDDLGNSINQTTTTNGSGAYSFSGLRPGSYTVSETQPAGYLDGKDAVGTVAGSPEGALVPPDAIGSIDLDSGDAGVNYNFGEITTSTPNFTLVKSADQHVIAPYQKVTYSYTVTNTGGTTLMNIVVTDDNGTPGYAGDDFTVGTIPSLAPGASVTLTAMLIPVVSTIAVVNGNPVNAGMVLVTPLANGDIKATYLQSFGINDNTYGTGAIGWPNGHKFSDLTGSDHLEFRFSDKNGNVVIDFYLDYITATSNTATYPSGYASLCATGGDGSMVSGSAANIVSCTTSLADNLNNPLNVPNKAALILNSPTSLVNGNVVVDMTKAPGGWNYINSYTVVVKGSTFGAAGFGSLAIPDQHNSPSKLGVNQISTSPANSLVTNTATATTTSGGLSLTNTASESVNIVVSGGGGGGSNLTIIAEKLDKSEVQITIKNGGTADAILSELNLTWPAVNGKLRQVKLNGDMVYDTPDIAPPTADITAAQMTANVAARTIPKGASKVLHLVFEHAVDKDKTHYSGLLSFTDGTDLIIP